ncbi:hypothetical protein ACWGDE_20495 [Streptomyces sp. NPDC054956]
MLCTLCGDNNGKKTDSDHEIDNCPWRGISDQQIAQMLNLSPTDRLTSTLRCETCVGKGETAETVRVGSRRAAHETADRQTALCLTCFGTGQAPTT